MQEARILDSGRSEWLPGMQETRIRNDNDDDDDKITAVMMMPMMLPVMMIEDRGTRSTSSAG